MSPPPPDPDPDPGFEAPTCPGAVAPERRRFLAGSGVSLCLHEWGDPDAPPLLLCHGMFDHGRGFDRLAPLLAQHFRVIAMDARGHGDSSWADAYSWPSDLYDIVAVLRSFGRPVHLIGHSKGGGQAMDAAGIAPECVRQLVSIDGFGPPPEGFEERRRPDEPLPVIFRQVLDRWRVTPAERGWRVYPSFDDLVSRRQQQNPRLPADWLRYFAFHGARQVEGGWRWKVDPLATGGFGPFRVDWIAPGWRAVQAPLLAIIGSEPDTWGPLPEAILQERFAYIRSPLERAVIQDSGHFPHMEQPEQTARVLLDFLDRKPL